MRVHAKRNETLSLWFVRIDAIEGAKEKKQLHRGAMMMIEFQQKNGRSISGWRERGGGLGSEKNGCDGAHMMKANC